MNKKFVIIAMAVLALVSFAACRGSGGQIMDGSGSSKKKEPAVVVTKDLSKDRPKTIESGDMSYFMLRFENNYGSYGLGDQWPSGYYAWQIDKRDGVYVMSIQDTVDSHLEMNYLEEVEDSYVKGLDDLIKEMELAEYNGYYMTDNGSSRTYFLNARYESGEELTIQAKGKVADTCVFDIPRLMEYAAIKTDGVDDITENENSTPTKENVAVKDDTKNNTYEGTWYSQDEENAVLTIKNDGMTFKEADIDSSASFEPEAKENYVSLSVTSELFYLYEINYYPGEDRIEAYTQPELDGDGGYKRIEFRRTAYGPGDKAMLEYLYGAWEIMDDGELIQEPGIRRDILYFPLPQYKTVRFVRANGDKKTFNIELTDVFDDTVKTGTYDRLTLSAKFSSGEYTWDEVRPGQSFQILIANNLGMDYLMLRELGDERTGFATDGLQYERSMSGIWFFKRPDSDTYDGEYDTEGTTPSTVGNEEQVRLKDTSFYAIKWLEFGNSCTLQRVEVQGTKAALGSSSEDALGYYLPDDEYAYSAVNYEYSGMENVAHGGYFDPALVQVVTDESGQIVEMSKYEYAWDGMYYEHSEKILQK